MGERLSLVQNSGAAYSKKSHNRITLREALLRQAARYLFGL